ncbi:MAG: hypothetical protein WBD53_14755 [Xanthobacteraceae bacterium]
MARQPRQAAPQSAAAVARTAHLQASGQKQIAGTVIYSRFISCLGLTPDVDLTQPLTSILGGGLNNWDLGLDLMSYGPFKQDGLILQKSDVMTEVTIGGLCNLVFAWYKSDGWTVT